MATLLKLTKKNSTALFGFVIQHFKHSYTYLANGLIRVRLVLTMYIAEGNSELKGGLLSLPSVKVWRSSGEIN